MLEKKKLHKKKSFQPQNKKTHIKENQNNNISKFPPLYSLGSV